MKKRNIDFPCPRRMLASSFMAAALASGLSTFGQASDSQSEDLGDEIFELSPFEVNVDKDDGFLATNAGTATKLGLDMKDIAAPYGVMTSEFIQSIGITDLQEAILWSTNGAPVFDGQGADLWNIPSIANVRGIVLVSGQQRDFFVNAGIGDSYSIGRIDFGRGPNAVLFNVGANDALGGGISMSSKRARFDRDSLDVSFKIGSWDYYRTTVDANAVINDKFALRANLLMQDRKGWLDNEFDDREGITLTGTYLFGENTSLRFDTSKDSIKRSRPPIAMFDNFSGWDGATTFDGRITNAMLSGNANAGDVYGLTYSGSPQGVWREGGDKYVYDPASNSVMNWVHSGGTRRGDENERVPVYIDGEPWVRGSNLLLPIGNSGGNGGNSRTPGRTSNGGLGALTDAINLPDSRFDVALANSNVFIPGRQFTITPEDPLFQQDFENLTLAFSHQVGDSLYIDLSANVNESYNTVINTHLDLRKAYLDLNEALPDGSANPNFLEPYAQMDPRYYNRSTKNSGVRAVIAYMKDLEKWGDYTFNLSLHQTKREETHRQYWMSVATAEDPREWQGQRLTTRYYWNDDARPFFSLAPTSLYEVDPISGGNDGYETSTLAIQPRWVLNDWWDNEETSTGAIFALAGKFFNDRLVVSPGVRIDKQESFRRSRPTSYGFLPDDPSWDGTTLDDRYWREDAPADWLDLSYIPKDASGNPQTSNPVPATGNRPTSGGVRGVNPGNPIYVSDRFRNDYNAPRYEKDIVNATAGLVYHVRPNISAMFNYGNSYKPSGVGRYTLLGDYADPETGIAYEAAVVFRMFDNRLNITPRYFLNRAENILGTPPTTSPMDRLVGRKSWDDDSVFSYNSLGFGKVAGQDSFARKNDGVEVEVVGRITKGWRVSGSFGTGQRTDFERWQDTQAYVDSRAGEMLQLLEAAGGALDTSTRPTNGGEQVAAAPGLAIANPDITDQMIIDAGGSASNRRDAVNDYNNMWIQYDNIGKLEDTVGIDRVTAKLFTDYSISDGRFKGLRFGAGFQWVDSDIAGYRSADTIANPDYDPSAALSNDNLPYMDDPTVDLNTPIEVDRPLEFTLTMGYRKKFESDRAFMGVRELDFNFVVRNLTNSQDVFYQDDGVVARPPNGDYTQPYRVSVPGRIANYQRPINFELTTTLKF